MSRLHIVTIILCVFILGCLGNEEVIEQVFTDPVIEVMEENNLIKEFAEITHEDNSRINDMKYFQPLGDDETLAFLRRDRNTVRIYAISFLQREHRLIFEYHSTVVINFTIQFSDDKSLGFLRVNTPLNSSPLYFIDGINGRIIHLLDTNSMFTVSNDGRFIALETRYNIALFDVEERKILENFYLNEIGFRFPIIRRDGRSNFRVFHELFYGFAYGEAEIDTQSLEIKIIRGIGGSGFAIDSEFYIDTRLPWHHNHILHADPFFRRGLGIELPPPEVGLIHRLAGGLAVFYAQDDSSEIISTLKWNQVVEILEISDEIVIDGIKTNWARVRVWGGDAADPWPTDIIGWSRLLNIIW